ncbi:hypothetical protein FRB95_011117 [Tulasnella sp. JGI-2019a]|nr:hypothetical protein FRB95_011117 [Tulasnella sp. JGI-2019a]
MAPKDIFKGPGAQKFQLVYRSQRDPLIHDAEASQQILKPLESRKGKTRADLETVLNPTELAEELKKRPNLGEASVHGVYFDDTKYDYMQHLRTVGEKEDNWDTFLVEMPGKKKQKPTIMTLKDPTPSDVTTIPDEFLPPKVELPKNYEAQMGVQSSIAGFRPDMNPHLRQTLEALEDEAFVDDELQDDFFGELLGDGEAEAEEDLDFPFDERGLGEDGHAAPLDSCADPEDANWESRFAQFKQTKDQAGNDEATDGVGSEKDYGASEGGDTVGTLPHLSVQGIKKRRKKSGSEASGYTMSSSSMYRNEGLTRLDEHFDAVYEREYENAHDIDCDCEDCEQALRSRRRTGDAGTSDEDVDDEAPDLLNSRDDIDEIMDEFLDKYEVVGRQLVPVLEGKTGVEKLETLRKAMSGVGIAEGQETKDMIQRLVRMQEEAEDEGDETILMPVDVDDVKDRWDCETILSTYTNLENHPRVIRVRESSRKVPKIRLDPATGMPIVEEDREIQKKSKSSIRSTKDSDRRALHDQIPGLRAEHDDGPKTYIRPRDESKEEKAARKQTTEAEKQARRVEKKSTKEFFAMEKQAQVKAQLGREKGGMGLKKL